MSVAGGSLRVGEEAVLGGKVKSGVFGIYSEGVCEKERSCVRKRDGRCERTYLAHRICVGRAPHVIPQTLTASETTKITFDAFPRL